MEQLFRHHEVLFSRASENGIRLGGVRLCTWRKDGPRVKRGKSPHRGTGDSTQVEVPKGAALEQKRSRTTPGSDRVRSVGLLPSPTCEACEPNREARELTSRGKTGRERWNGETSPVQADATVVPHTGVGASCPRERREVRVRTRTQLNAVTNRRGLTLLRVSAFRHRS